MKKAFLLLFWVLSCLFSQGQKVVKEVEKKFENGKPEIVAHYRDAVSTYNLLKREIWGADGKKVREENYLNGSLHGKVTNWKPFDGTVEMEQNYLQGKLTGPQKFYFSDGSLSQELNYLEGKLDGVQKEWWFKQGGDSLKSEHRYSNGMLHGLQKKWFKGFRPEYEMNFVAGKPDGKQMFWDDAGNLREENWRSGVLDEILETWPSGQPKQVRVMDFARQGDSLSVVLGKVLQKEMRYFETGSVEAITLMSGQPETQVFHFSGKLKAKGTGFPDQKAGRWEFWHPNGQKMSAGSFSGGKKVGLHETWDDKGNLREEETWNADGSKRESFKVAFYHSNGKKAMEGSLDESNRKMGMWKTWNASGLKQREENWTTSCSTSNGRPVLADFTEWDESGKIIKKGSESLVQVWTYFPSGDPMELSEFFYPFRDPCSADPVEVYADMTFKPSIAPESYAKSILVRKVVLQEGGDTLRVDRFNNQGKRHGTQTGCSKADCSKTRNGQPCYARYQAASSRLHWDARRAGG